MVLRIKMQHQCRREGRFASGGLRSDVTRRAVVSCWKFSRNISRSSELWRCRSDAIDCVLTWSILRSNKHSRLSPLTRRKSRGKQERERNPTGSSDVVSQMFFRADTLPRPQIDGVRYCVHPLIKDNRVQMRSDAARGQRICNQIFVNKVFQLTLALLVPSQLRCNLNIIELIYCAWGLLISFNRHKYNQWSRNLLV